MKQRKPLQQRTELQRKTPIRRTGFRSDTSYLNSGVRGSSGPVKPRKTGLKPGRVRQSAEERAARDLVEARSEGLCEIQVSGVCLGRAEAFSHRKRRSQSSKAEKWSAANGLAGCGSGTTGCEGYLTARGSTAEVRSKGWTVHPSVDPASVPVLRRGVYVWLHEDGSFTDCDLAEVAAWVLGTTGEVA